jgi:xylulokinase
MKDMGLNLKTVKAGNANMFLSPLFRDAFVNMNNVTLELYDTDGSQGAARGAGIGSGIYSNAEEAFAGLDKMASFEPKPSLVSAYNEVYQSWLKALGSVQ